MLIRNEHRVRNHVIHEWSPHRPRIAQVVDLNRRNPSRENPGPTVFAVPLEVDSDVDAVCSRRGDNFRIRHVPHIDKIFKCPRDARPHIVLRCRSERKCGHLESRPIMKFEQFSHQVRGGVQVKIGRKVTHANPIMRRPVRNDRRSRGGGTLCTRPGFRSLPLQRRSRRYRNQRERGTYRLRLRNPVGQ